MAEAYLSTDEENYVRMSLLITGVSPRGVRALFDSEFAPICLGASIKKEYTKLKELKTKHIINQSQWNLLFPKYPDVPDSKTFDVTLMITLLRHLTPIIPPVGGYDCLPQTAEVTLGADLSRIKYYRNYLAHLDNGKIDTTFFNTAWIDITSALGRFGGQKMKKDCEQLKIKHLDQTSHEIMNAIRHSSDEIRELKASVEYLQSSEKEMKTSYELLQENCEEVQHSHVKLQKTVTSYQQDTVPWNVRVAMVT
ncbi:E3 ubiquitin-protein ligase DZIP3-like [Mytilus trossulus]|uniref:E3 ubiquitin-protein ligase DZIP3-like n=1 Tax=Mytilus trossulus TaxID=6551 RepID=UPI003006687A